MPRPWACHQAPVWQSSAHLEGGVGVVQEHGVQRSAQQEEDEEHEEACKKEPRASRVLSRAQGALSSACAQAHPPL